MKEKAIERNWLLLTEWPSFHAAFWSPFLPIRGLQLVDSEKNIRTVPGVVGLVAGKRYMQIRMHTKMSLSHSKFALCAQDESHENMD